MNIPPDVETLQAGWILSVDKPLGWTSFDVVAKVRNALKRRYGVKVKIGHVITKNRFLLVQNQMVFVLSRGHFRFFFKKNFRFVLCYSRRFVWYIAVHI